MWGFFSFMLGLLLSTFSKSLQLLMFFLAQYTQDEGLKTVP